MFWVGHKERMSNSFMEDLQRIVELMKKIKRETFHIFYFKDYCYWKIGQLIIPAFLKGFGLINCKNISIPPLPLFAEVNFERVIS